MPHDGVIALGGGIHPPVVELKRQLDVRMLHQERVKGRAEMQAPQGDRRRNAQRSRERAASLRHVRDGVRDVMPDPRCPFQEGRAVVGQRQPARRTMRQRGA